MGKAAIAISHSRRHHVLREWLLHGRALLATPGIYWAKFFRSGSGGDGRFAHQLHPAPSGVLCLTLKR